MSHLDHDRRDPMEGFRIGFVRCMCGEEVPGPLSNGACASCAAPARAEEPKRDIEAGVRYRLEVLFGPMRARLLCRVCEQYPVVNFGSHTCGACGRRKGE